MAASLFLQAVRQPDITLADVGRIIERFECFTRAPERSGVNPFTKERIICSGEGKAIFTVNDVPVGNFGLEDGRLLFTGVPDEIGRQVAEFIDAKLLPWDAS